MIRKEATSTSAVIAAEALEFEAGISSVFAGFSDSASSSSSSSSTIYTLLNPKFE